MLLRWVCIGARGGPEVEGRKSSVGFKVLVVVPARIFWCDGDRCFVVGWRKRGCVVGVFSSELLLICGRRSHKGW